MTNTTRIVVQVSVVFLLLALGVGILVFLTLSKPPLAKKAPVVVLPLVRVIKAEPKAVDITVSGEGTVASIRQTTVSAEVGGKVVFVSPKLISGGEFAQDEIMLGIDPADYKLSRTLKRAQVLEAQTMLQRTQAEAAAAREEWRLVAGDKKSPPPLLVKRPQLAEAQAKLAAAKSQLAQAELNLKRTELRAPFACRVNQKYVDLGQYLRSGDKVATVFDIRAAEVVVHLEDRELAWLKVPGLTGGGGEGSSALVISNFAGNTQEWQGRIVRAQGMVDERTRLVPVVVRVEEPYARRPPLNPGIFVKVSLSGHGLKRAFVLPRAALRNGGLVWLVQDGRLLFKEVEVARTQGEEVLITSGLEEGEMVITTPLKAVSKGMRVRVVEPEDQG
jgi:RND family efflux transporter MFP subunit